MSRDLKRIINLMLSAFFVMSTILVAGSELYGISDVNTIPLQIVIRNRLEIMEKQGEVNNDLREIQNLERKISEDLMRYRIACPIVALPECNFIRRVILQTEEVLLVLRDYLMVGALARQNIADVMEAIENVENFMLEGYRASSFTSSEEEFGELIIQAKALLEIVEIISEETRENLESAKDLVLNLLL